MIYLYIFLTSPQKHVGIHQKHLGKNFLMEYPQCMFLWRNKKNIIGYSLLWCFVNYGVLYSLLWCFVSYGVLWTMVFCELWCFVFPLMVFCELWCSLLWCFVFPLMGFCELWCFVSIGVDKSVWKNKKMIIGYSLLWCFVSYDVLYSLLWCFVSYGVLWISGWINLCPGYDVKLHPAVTLNMSVGMWGCPLSQLPPHLQGYQAATT